MQIMRGLLFVTFLLSLHMTYSSTVITDDINNDVGLNTLQLIKRYGFQYERHQVETEDGYILEMHRIPHGRNNSIAHKGPVFVMHGILCSSADWVNNGHDSLGFILADLGYDVWLGNSRGNTWSRKHKILNPDLEPETFWDFSWDEIGMYDLPACIDYILEITGKKQLYYLGHSQGTTVFFVMASERPEYNDKIKLMVAMAPVVFLDHGNTYFMNFVGDFKETLKLLTEYLGVYEFLPHKRYITSISKTFCEEDSRFFDLCNFLFMADDSEQFDSRKTPVIFSNYPAGCATKEIFHFAQVYESARFQKFDYGDENIQKYGDIIPPNYNLYKVTAPVVIYYGQSDKFISITDIKNLVKELPNVIRVNKVPYKPFNHMDFHSANDVLDLLYNDVISTMDKF